MKEVGTLKELDVKPGDVVENMKSRIRYTITDSMYVGSVMVRCSTDPYELISRATPSPKLWCDMTDAEKGALLLARHDGKVIEYKRYNGVWCLSCGDFVGFGTYRVRPEPKVETHNHVVFACGENRRTKYNTIDGKVDWSSFEVMDK